MEQENEIVKSSGLKDYAAVAVVAGATVFGVYQLGKLGVDWVKETRRNRKN